MPGTCVHIATEFSPRKVNVLRSRRTFCSPVEAQLFPNWKLKFTESVDLGIEEVLALLVIKANLIISRLISASKYWAHHLYTLVSFG